MNEYDSNRINDLTKKINYTSTKILKKLIVMFLILVI